MTETALILILIIVVLVLGVYYIPRLFMKRAVRQIVSVFRKREALSPDTALPLEELGLGPKSYMDRMLRVRDYKPHAARLLRQADILRMTEEGKFYISEATLDASPVKKWAGME